MTRNLPLALLFFVMVAGYAAADETGMTSRIAGRMTAVLTEKMAQYGLPGATGAVVLEDGTPVSVAVGMADTEAGVPMTPSSRLASGSIGKTFVPVVALILEHEGVLSLDDPISKYLGDAPWFERLPNSAEISLLHLLTHSSGVGDHVYEPAFGKAIQARWAASGDPELRLTPEELVAFILDKDPLFPPGKGFAYTDTGYILAGMVIEAASGTRYNDLVTERLLEPLGLSLTTVAEGLAYGGLASGYVSEEDARLGMTKVSENEAYKFSPHTEWTGGGLVTNALDLAKWAKALYEEKALPFPYLLRLLHSGYHGDLSHLYGLGVFVRQERAGLMYGHGGYYPGYNSSMYYFPAHKTAVVFQTNTSSNVDRNDIVLDLAIAVQAEIDAASH